jgi:hypothetical protein
MQTTFANTERPSPLPLSENSYVPSLLDRAGERDALSHVSPQVWETMTPVVHFHGPPKVEGPMKADRFTRWSKRIADVTRGHLFYLDLSRPSPRTRVKTGKGDVLIHERLYGAMRKRDASFIPVASVGPDFDVVVNSVANCSLQDGRGLALRYRFREIAAKPGETHASRLQACVEKLGTAAEDTDLFIDLAYIDPDDEFDASFMARQITKMMNAGPWRAVAMMGGSMPTSLGVIPEGTVGRIERKEWTLWRELQKQDLPRVLAFGDYAIQNPKPPSTGGPSMRRSIRYSAAETTVIARAKGPHYESDNRQYRELCEWLLVQPEICPVDYSWGDATIAGCAARKIAPRAQEMWRGAGTSHHLQFVSDQLRE